MSVNLRAAARRLIPPALVLAGVLGVWDALTRFAVVQEFLLPSPWAVIADVGLFLGRLVIGGEGLPHFLTTLSEIILGFILAIVVGVVIGTLMSEFRWINKSVYPLVVGFDSTPKVAIAPLLIIWFGFGLLSKVVLVMMIAVFPIIINTLAGLHATDARTIRLMHSLGASRREIFVKVRVQKALPFFFAGLEVAITGASIGAVVAEFSGGNKGLGFLTLRAQELFQLSEGLAIVVVLALQGIALHRIIILMRRRLVFWNAETHEEYG